MQTNSMKKMVVIISLLTWLFSCQVAYCDSSHWILFNAALRAATKIGIYSDCMESMDATCITDYESCLLPIDEQIEEEFVTCAKAQEGCYATCKLEFDSCLLPPTYCYNNKRSCEANCDNIAAVCWLAASEMVKKSPQECQEDYEMCYAEALFECDPQ